MKPFTVGLTNKSNSIMARFTTEKKAAAYIDTLPEHITGIYYLDGPERG